ncbi:TIGR03986 family CRISPR-associated RAMP protein [Ectothiorhodospira mobilis]|uniref:TIGR03986 family type III CRISPR-associated RAMP protein n=1 Tax=Ectothiorhodospira mobilis TaxID=195064 RepID=UPI001EE99B44|nr:TIGR03986 family CRISPR-associated RAMP protein [Ectothiorhodospira mobilis]MCG5536615.1 TIGR03986 family CRISPR-associated RAMP protein [Ectothiorhodospira mobilis]
MADRNGNRGGQEQAISAPYNFVPLSGWVHTPEWGPQVGHDRPFRDGVSGTLAFTLQADSPLLVGGHQKTPSEDSPGEVHPFRLGDNGPCAIPGSSLKGMLRSVVEIAGFGRMRMVDDQRLSIRDLAGAVSKTYREKMAAGDPRKGFKPKARAGWLRIDAGSGHAQIFPCRYARVEHDLIAEYSGDHKWWHNIDPGKDTSAHFKYDRWKKASKESLETSFTVGPEETHHHRQANLVYRKVLALGEGDKRGTLVFTGQPGRAQRDEKSGKRIKSKHMEFVFFDCEEESREVPEPVWRNFLQIHANSDDWEKWREKPWIPIFYLDDGKGGIASMGLALMYRLAYDNSIHEAIENTGSEHLALPGEGHGYDLADLLFGTVGAEQDAALRGRVTCEYAIAEGDPRPMKPQTTILNGPKPTFYPNYVVQKENGKGRLKGNGYATFMDKDVTIRGFKRYPARPADQVAVQEVTGKQKENKKVQVKLYPLEPGTTFRGRIRFHNLRPAELGALLWAMTWGGNQEFRHGLGMGKPFGFGQVRLEVDPAATELRPNDPSAGPVSTDEATLDEYRQAFVAHMEAEHGRRGGAWATSRQIANLLAMADPANAPQYEAATGTRLHHPRLEDNRINEFQDAKKAHAVLPDYAASLGVETGGEARGSGGAGDYGHPWLDEAIPRLVAENNARDAEEIIRGKVLAEAWKGLEGEEREAVGAAIKDLWEARGLLEAPPKPQKKLMRNVYGWLE